MLNSSRFALALLLSLWLAGTGWLRADISLSPLFADHMVLQKSQHVIVYGKANPDENVTVTINGVTGTGNAGADGRWRAYLDLSKQGPGPFDLTVQGKNTITLHDVLIGEVWICGGQSNMELPVDRTMDAPAVIAASANPQIRLFQCKGKFSATPLDDPDGAWSIAGPATTGKYTAVGYYFAKVINKELGVPVGLLSCNYGGSSAEAWMSREALSQDPDLNVSAGKFLDAYTSYPQLLQDFQSKYAAWQSQNHREDKPTPDLKVYAGPAANTTDWKPVSDVTSLAKSGLPDSGIIWLRTTVKVNPAQAGNYLPIHLGTIHDFDTVYWNGDQFGFSSAEKTTSFNDDVMPSLNRRYDAPAPKVMTGTATLAIRIFAPAGGAGITGANMPDFGPWLAKVETEFPPLDSAAKAAYPQRPLIPGGERNTATVLYNGMLHPLIPYTIRGVLWYQGESNVGHAAQYRTTFPLLITDWRKQWGKGDMPFYWCQISNNGPLSLAPGNSAAAELRDAQASTLSLPSTGQALTLDLGEVADVHYRDKKDVGDRIALIALANTYGRQVPFSGPTYDSMTVEGNSIRIKFQHTDQGLVAKPLPEKYALKSTMPVDQPMMKPSTNSQLQGFAICGADQKWAWANAKIDGNTVVVSADAVPQPVAVRYAWSDNPVANLYNGAGLPACPFRTDNFPLTTLGKNY